MIFVTSDWHLSHDKEFIWKTRGYNSIEEMNYDLIKKHNSLVTANDDVYVLGDCCLGGQNMLEQNRRLMEQFNGKLHIIFGNHCTPARREMYKELPNVVECAWSTMIKYQKYNFYLSHFPVLTSNLEKSSHLRGHILNLYGHTHQKDNFYQDNFNMYHVGLDSHNCYPVSLDDILSQIRKKFNECLGKAAN